MKKIKIIALSFVVCLAACDSSSDDNDNDESVQFEGVIEWSKTIGGGNGDTAYSIVNTFDGNVAVLGFTSSTDGDINNKSLNVNDYWLMKIDPEGNLLWNKTYGGTDDDRGQKLVQTQDGGFAMAGFSKSSDGDASNNEGFHDNWLVKTDNSGNFIWEKSYGFAGNDHAYALVETQDNGFFMAGSLDAISSGGLGNTSKSSNNSKAVLHAGGEYWCHKLDAQGNVEWQRFFGGTSDDRAFGTIQANDGGYIVTGLSESNDLDITNNRGNYDYWVIKLNSTGDILWEKSFGGTGIDQSRSVVKTEDNGYIIAGNSFSEDIDVEGNYGSSDFWLVKIDDNGNTVWKKNYGGFDFDLATNIKKSRDGYVVSGYSQSSNNDLKENYGDNDFWVIKINERGDLLWEKNFGGSALDLAYDVVESPAGDIYVVGETESTDFDILENKGGKDLLIVKIK